MATKLIFNPLSGNFDAVTVITATAVGSTPNANAVTIGSDGATIQLQPADATHPGVVTSGAQTFGGNKTFAGSIAVSSIDTASSGGTLALGTLNATTINIGNVGATVNIMGTVITEQSTTLNVTNPVFTVNSGGGAGSASNAGMQVNENNVITGYVETSADRNSWILKAPNTAGVATITPGVSGITIAGNVSGNNTGDVTLGTANGLSLAGQVLSLALASATTTGALSSADWNTFNNKQSALTLGNLTDTGTDGITITGGNGAVVGSGTTIAQAQATASQNGYLGSADFTIFTNKANQSLNNLASTAVNVAINPATNNAIALGTPTLSWGNIYGNSFRTVNGSYQLVNAAAFFSVASVPSIGTGGIPAIQNNASSASPNARDVGMFTASNTSTGVAGSGAVYIETGLGGTGTTGDINLNTGTTTGTRGKILLNASFVDVNNTQIKNLATPTLSTDAATKGYVDALNPSTDIPTTSFTAANNVSTPANVTGLAFANASVRAFTASVSVTLLASANLYEYFELKGIQKGSSWEMSIQSAGDSSGILFSITTAGQVQYTSANSAGFVSDTMKFRATTLPV